MRLQGAALVRLDVADAAAVAALAAQLGDVDLVINNAGVANTGKLLAADSSDALRWMMETNVFGILEMSRHFAPVLGRNGGGAFVNVLTRGFDLPKLDTGTVVERSFAALEAGASEVLVDETTRAVKQGLNAEPPAYTLA